jgi:predicted acyltransferase (DUF342 family)
MVFDRKILVIPDNVKYEEHNIVTSGDVVIGDRTEFGLGVITDGRIFVGEKAKISGSLSTTEDVRIDMWSEVIGDLKTDKSVFLADKVKVKGKLSVGQDLDISDSSEVEKFEAKGWINVRSPISLFIYMYLYLLELMRQGKSQEVELILNELDEDEEDIVISEIFTFVPNDSEVSLQQTSVKGHCSVGNNCRILGNYSVTGFMKIGNKTRFHGSIEAGRDVDIGSESEIVGSIISKGKVTIEGNTHIHGDIKAKNVELLKSAIVEGKIQAVEGVVFATPESRDIKTKVERFERGLDDLDAVLD